MSVHLDEVKLSELAKIEGCCIIVSACGLLLGFVATKMDGLALDFDLRFPLYALWIKVDAAIAVDIIRLKRAIRLILRTCTETQVTPSIVDAVPIFMVAELSFLCSENKSMHKIERPTTATVVNPCLGVHQVVAQFKQAPLPP